jgi:ABC-type Zn uptake system ZnuABC Zn-binding protein ZnuA
MTKQNPNNTSGRPVTSRDDLAKVQNQVQRQTESNFRQYEADLAKLDNAFSRQFNKPTKL